MITGEQPLIYILISFIFRSRLVRGYMVCRGVLRRISVSYLDSAVYTAIMYFSEKLYIYPADF